MFRNWRTPNTISYAGTAPSTHFRIPEQSLQTLASCLYSGWTPPLSPPDVKINIHIFHRDRRKVCMRSSKPIQKDLRAMSVSVPRLRTEATDIPQVATELF